MAKKRGGRSRVKRPRAKYLLERTSLIEIQTTKRAMEALLRYHWNFYSELAYQRKQIDEQLRAALGQNCESNYSFTGWQRAVKYRYGLHPLCTIGSTFDPGGRFNIGDVAPQNFPPFPALYVAEDKDTALQEALGQSPSSGSELAPQELALTNPQSETIVSVSGQLDRVFDLTTPDRLNDFLELVKNFQISSTLRAEAARVEQDPKIARSVAELMKVLLDKDWRNLPMQVDIPAGPQIFGQIAHAAGISGILYPSKFTGKKCVAIFPHNFEDSSSFVKLDDQPPHPNVPTRVDSTNWAICDISAEEALKLKRDKN
jgi:RES domain-containing protein